MRIAESRSGGPGYVQCGRTAAYDRVLVTRFNVAAVDALHIYLTKWAEPWDGEAGGG